MDKHIFWIIGVLLAAIASILSNLGVNIQKLCHMRLAQAAMERSQTDSSQAPYHARDDALRATMALSMATVLQRQQHYYRSPLWMWGLTLVIIGSICDFAALAFGNQSLIAPLGSLTLVANVIFAPLLLGERITRHDLFATMAITAGSIVTVFSASHRDRIYTIETLFDIYLSKRFIILACIVIGAIVCMYVTILNIESYKRTNVLFYQQKLVKVHRFLYSALAGTIGSQNVLFAKTAAELIINAIQGKGIFLAYWPSYVVLLSLGTTTFLQILWLNAALRLFDAMFVVPVFQTFWILISVITGLIFFDETQDMYTYQKFTFPIGIMLTLAGVFMLSRRRIASDHGDICGNDAHERLKASLLSDPNSVEERMTSEKFQIRISPHPEEGFDSYSSTSGRSDRSFKASRSFLNIDSRTGIVESNECLAPSFGPSAVSNISSLDWVDNDTDDADHDSINIAALRDC